MIIKIGVDTGITNTKAVHRLPNGEIIKVCIPTSIREALDGLVLSNETYKTKVDNKEYVVGEYKERKSPEQSPDKANNIHRVSVLTAIFKVLEQANYDNVETVEISLNIPFNLFVDKNEHYKMKQLYERDFLEIEVDGHKKFFNLRINLYPEGLGIALKNYDKFGKEKVSVLMLGSIHWSIITFTEAMQPISLQTTIDEYGTLYLVDEIRKELYSKNYEMYDRDIIERLISRTKRHMKEHDYEISEKLAVEYLKKVRSVAHDREIRFDITDTIIAGGGALLLQEQIKRTFKQNTTITDNDPLFADAIGSLSLLK